MKGASHTKPRGRQAQLAFEALSIEGGLLSPEWLVRAAQLQAGSQTEADYRIPKGLNLRDEIGRYWRIAQAQWGDFAAGLSSGADSRALAERFVLALLRDCFGFASLAQIAPIEIDQRTYPIGWCALGQRVPVVIAPAPITPAETTIDTPIQTFGDSGRRRSAFGLAQEFLNAAPGAMWGLVSDGLILRILRDNGSMTRPAWIEADLGRIFTEERYADFAALWLLAHETRFGKPDQPVTDCALETWRNAGREEGTRAREHLRRGVEEALIALGKGFLTHPDNSSLRAALQDGSLTTTAYFQQLLRLVYRLIFLLTVEERGLLHPTSSSDSAKKLYAEGYSLNRLRERSVKRSAHDRFSDLWEAVKIVFRCLGPGEPRLALPALAGIFAKAQCPALDAAKLENRALLLAVFRLSWLREASGLSRVNWRDMGPEELGSVYESLLELVPRINQGGREFTFAEGGETKGNARKTSGSYYTPDSLVQVLLDSALEPVIAQTIAAYPTAVGWAGTRPAPTIGNTPDTHVNNRPDIRVGAPLVGAHDTRDTHAVGAVREPPLQTSATVDALLNLAIVDPACGSGHFLLAAARRLAGHVARLQANGTPSAAEYRHALRQVVGHCIYGVDLNPMAVELCKVSLWMEAVEPGLPLTFLDSHIQHGNSLLGATPELMAKGIPDDAWSSIEGDDKKVASALKKRNKKAAEGQRGLDTLWSKTKEDESGAVTRAVADLDAASDADAAALANKESRWDGILESPEYKHQKFVADAWCAAFVWPKQPGPLATAAPTNELWRQIRDGQGQPPALTIKTTSELVDQYHFLHWHLAFPQVFTRSGFDVVLGNPPWERVKLQEQEFFSSRNNQIATAPNAAARKKLIAALIETDPVTWADWCAASREAEGESHFVRQSERYPLCGQGDVNTYALFAEHNRTLLRPKGRAGFIVPAGLVADDTTKEFFQALAESHALSSVFHFENEGKVFTEVHHAFRFVLLTIGPADRADLLFYARRAEDLADADRHFSLSASDFSLLNPNTRTSPTFRSRRDANLNLSIYRRAGVAIREGDPDGNPWRLQVRTRTWHMAEDSEFFRTYEELIGCDRHEQQIGGESPDPGPERREPDTETTRA